MSHLFISVTVESRLSGPASGHHRVDTESSATVDSVIAAFCTEKGIPQKKRYVLRNINDVILDSTRTLMASAIVDGDVLYLTTRGEGDDTFGFLNWYIMAALAFVIGIVGLVSVCLIYSNTGQIPDDYGIVFDAGSMHTGMMMYSWYGAKVNNTGAIIQIHKCTIDSGIASYTGRHEELESALDQCVEEGRSVLPGGKVATTPIYLGATGGMRLLEIKNKTAVNEVMDVVQDTFSKSGFQYSRGMSSIILGSQEGADAWITTNYLFYTLKNRKLINSSTAGTLDLGGASTQFAFLAQPNETVGQIAVTLFNSTYNVMTNSYLCYGRAQANLRHTAQLTLGYDKTNLTVEDPCLPIGYNYTRSVKYIFNSPCTWMNDTLRPQENINITVYGTSKYQNCSQKVKSLLNLTECVSYYGYQYCFKPINLSKLEMTFVAIAGFYDVMQLLNLTDATVSLDQFLKVVTFVCNKTWNETKLLFNNPDNGSKAWSYCFQSQYVYHLLTTGYSFNNGTWHQLQFLDSVKGTDLGWTLGYMMNQTNTIPVEPPKVTITFPVFVSLLVLFIFFVLISAAFLIHAWKRKHDGPKYQRLSQYESS